MHRTLVYIGRFQPFHTGHEEVIEWALTQADTLVVVLGSDSGVPTFKDPWSAATRAAWIGQNVRVQDVARVRFASVPDYPNNDLAWRSDVQRRVFDIVPPRSKVFITGYRKDASSYYLQSFPQWSFLGPESASDVHATAIREAYFKHRPRRIWAENLPHHVAAYLDSFKHTALFKVFSKGR